MEYVVKNVNEAFTLLVSQISRGKLPTIETESRAGKVLQVTEPVMVTYKQPRQRVLFNAARDANPFFHLFESLWMLAGCNDVASLLRYNSKIGNIASDDGKTFNGAYGYRWRHSNPKFIEYGTISDPGDEYSSGDDQIQIIIDHLRKNPQSRRAVLQMWNVEDDLLKIETSKDVCCNTNVYFLIREKTLAGATVQYLDMTVCNRSNDLIWGMLGANVVHFSILQEYIANCLNVSVGRYTQFTNNLHIYLDNWKPDEWIAVSEYKGRYGYESTCSCRYDLVIDQETFDNECLEIVTQPIENQGRYKEPFLDRVVRSMLWAFEFHKRRNYAACLNVLTDIESEDWREACTNWILRRKESWERKKKPLMIDK